MEEHPPLHVDVVAIEKGAFGSPLAKVANFTYIFTAYLFVYLFVFLSTCLFT